MEEDQRVRDESLDEFAARKRYLDTIYTAHFNIMGNISHRHYHILKYEIPSTFDRWTEESGFSNTYAFTDEDGIAFFKWRQGFLQFQAQNTTSPFADDWVRKWDAIHDALNPDQAIHPSLNPITASLPVEPTPTTSTCCRRREFGAGSFCLNNSPACSGRKP